MKIKRMTSEGRKQFIAFLDARRKDHSHEFPERLLGAPELAIDIGGDTSMLDKLDLDDKLVAAKSINEIVLSLGLSSAERDWGFWSWCSAYLFHRLCKKTGPGEMAIWIADSENLRRYYRHYLASIWRVYMAHADKEDKLVVLLSGPVNVPGELWGQIAATKTLITNPAMIDVIYKLYWDENTQKRKRGAGGESVRRLTGVLKQFERTYDFVSMSGDEIIGLLPAEFNKFKA